MNNTNGMNDGNMFDTNQLLMEDFEFLELPPSPFNTSIPPSPKANIQESEQDKKKQKTKTLQKPKKQKRVKKKLRVCQSCKDSHTKCDGNRPCARCERMGLECVDAVQKKRGRKKKKRNRRSSSSSSPSSPSSKKQKIVNITLDLANSTSTFGLDSDSKIGVLVVTSSDIGRGRILHWNQTLREWLGYEKGDLYERVKTLDDITDDAGELYQNCLYLKMFGELNETTNEFELKTKENEKFKVLANTTNLQDNITKENMITIYYIHKEEFD